MIAILLLLAGDAAWSGGDLVVADTTLRVGERVLGASRVITSIAISPDGARLVESGGRAGKSGRLALWNLSEGKLLWEKELQEDLIYEVVWSPDGRRIFAAGGDRRIGVYDPAGKEIEVLAGHAGAVLCLAASADGTLASSGSDRTIRIWKDGACVQEIRNHLDRINDLAFHPGTGRLASASDDGTVRAWEPASGRLVRILRHTGTRVLSVAWAGDRLVTGCTDGKVRLLDPERASILEVLRDHGDWVTAIAVAGPRIASIDATGQPLLTDLPNQ